MKRLSLDIWENIFRNLAEENEEVEILYLDNTGKPGEYGLCFDCELFEDGFTTEQEARERLEYLQSQF